jgi:hypothetical protein
MRSLASRAACRTSARRSARRSPAPSSYPGSPPGIAHTRWRWLSLLFSGWSALDRRSCYRPGSTRAIAELPPSLWRPASGTRWIAVEGKDTHSRDTWIAGPTPGPLPQADLTPCAALYATGTSRGRRVGTRHGRFHSAAWRVVAGQGRSGARLAWGGRSRARSLSVRPIQRRYSDSLVPDRSDLARPRPRSPEMRKLIARIDYSLDGLVPRSSAGSARTLHDVPGSKWTAAAPAPSS